MCYCTAVIIFLIITSQQDSGSIEEQPNENVTKEWFEALRADNLETVKRLLKSGKIDINCKDQVIILHIVALSKKKSVSIFKQKRQLAVHVSVTSQVEPEPLEPEPLKTAKNGFKCWGKKKQQHFTDSIRIFKKLMTKYSHKKCTKTFQIWKNKNVNKTQCFYSETVPFRKNNFRNGTKLLPKRVNKQLRPNIQILCLTYSCKVVPAAPENTS